MSYWDKHRTRIYGGLPKAVVLPSALRRLVLPTFRLPWGSGSPWPKLQPPRTYHTPHGPRLPIGGGAPRPLSVRRGN
jgi:hypothetical protein